MASRAFTGSSAGEKPEAPRIVTETKTAYRKVSRLVFGCGDRI